MDHSRTWTGLQAFPAPGPVPSRTLSLAVDIPLHMSPWAFCRESLQSTSKEAEMHTLQELAD